LNKFKIIDINYQNDVSFVCLSYIIDDVKRILSLWFGNVSLSYCHIVILAPKINR